MNKPNDYDSVSEYTYNTPLEPGGYVCRIVQVQETTAQNSGAAMLKIGLEIAEGTHKNYYTEMFKNDTRQEKKWPCIVNQLVYDTSGATNRGLKTFNTCVERSNPGFKVVWGDGYAGCFKGKLIGGVFRREQFISSSGEKKFTTKCFSFRSVEEIRKGVPVPKDKLLDDPGAVTSGFSAPSNVPQTFQPNTPIDLSGFEEIIPNESLPF